MSVSQVRYGDLRLESRVSHVTLEQEVDLQVRSYSYGPVMSHKYEAAYWSEWTTCSSQCQIGRGSYPSFNTHDSHNVANMTLLTLN